MTVCKSALPPLQVRLARNLGRMPLVIELIVDWLVPVAILNNDPRADAGIPVSPRRPNSQTGFHLGKFLPHPGNGKIKEAPHLYGHLFGPQLSARCVSGGRCWESCPSSAPGANGRISAQAHSQLSNDRPVSRSPLASGDVFELFDTGKMIEQFSCRRSEISFALYAD